MESLSILERVERLEKLAGVAGPAICPDPTGEGSAWQGEGAPVIPLEDGFDGVHPDDARDGDEFFNGGWNIAGDVRAMPSWLRTSVPWRRRKSPAEPAPGSDAEHPPLGYVLVDDDAPICASWLCWTYGKGPWESVLPTSIGWIPSHRAALYPLARPIPANEGDSQKAESIEDVINRFEGIAQRLANVTDERDELRATVERLTAENDDLRRDNLDLRASRAKAREALG